MNDFTKEELEELKRCCNWVINCKDTHYTTTTYGLPEKIQSMFDNYCEHEIIEPYYIGDNRHYNCSNCEKEMCIKGEERILIETLNE